MKTKEAILKEYVKDIYLFTHGTLEKREQFTKSVLGAMETYAQQAGEGLREALEAQAEYIKFLNNAYNRIYLMAHVHGYRESLQDIEKGKEMRQRISALSGKQETEKA